ncbi:MAG: Ig-like domain-containing protein [Paludibacteraceae bacterium]|nr:Ig-like domain-containing protein [Paludibacteraceae bacterium]
MVHKNGIKALALVVLSLLAAACANRGLGPQGGPEDVTPPALKSSMPSDGARNFHGKKVELHFDEIVQIENPFENVIVSPAQSKQPTVKAIGKKVTVEFNDTLRRNTTYTIDFGSALSDFNEKNALNNFAFSFSTGSDLDTLALDGVVLNAQTLDPVTNAVVGIYESADDSLFVSVPLSRMTRTDAQGKFLLRNLPAGSYRVFALQDLNRDNFFDQPEESLAFTSDLLPSVALREVQDSVSETDSTRIFSHYETDNKIILRQFKEETSIQYLIKSERKSAEHFKLFFNDGVRELPRIEPLNFSMKSDFLTETTSRRDTITYWIKDSTLILQDTLRMLLHYEKTDSTGVMVAATDTLELKYISKKAFAPQESKKNAKSSAKKKQKQEAPKQEFLRVSSNADNGKMECYDDLTLRFKYPVEHFEQDSIHLYVLQDTVRIPLTYEMKPTGSMLSYMVYNEDLDVEKKYVLAIDSAAITDIYGHVCNKQEIAFELQPFEQYATLIMKMPQAKPNAVVQLLSDKEEVKEQKPLEDGQVTFKYLHPGAYRVRMFVDENRNGVWDTGKYSEKRQPEEVFYYNKKLNLRANWQITENWSDFLTTPLEEQKTKLK